MYNAAGGKTEGLKKHLRLTHENVWKDVDSDMKKRKEEKAMLQKETLNKRRKLGIGAFKPGDKPKNQPTIVEATSKLSKVDPKGAIQKQYDEALIELICCNFLSFNLVESPEFHKFVQVLNKAIF